MLTKEQILNAIQKSLISYKMNILDDLYINQNAFSNVKIGSTVISADSVTDTLTLTAGSNITLTPDTSSDNITLSAKDTTYTVNSPLSLSGTTISHATSGASAGSYGDSGNQTPAYGGTFKVPYITVNNTGHVTSISQHTVKIPASDNTDTKMNVTLGTTSKAYLVGVTTAPTSTAQALTGISDTGVYLDTTAGQLTATTFKGALSGNATSANKVNNALTIQGNGTSLASFDGSGAKTVNITPANIGATTESYVNSSISALDLYDDNKNIYIKNSAGTLGSGLHGTIVRYISPTSFSEFLQMTQNPGVYYVLSKVTTTYNSETVTILGLIDSRKSGSNYNYYGIQKMNQFIVNSSGQITSYSQLTQYILDQIPNTYAGSSSAGGSATSAEKVNHKLTITNYNLDINESFDGSSDISLDLTPDTIGAAWKNHGDHVTFTTTVPKANGTAAVGTATTVSRSDHVHPLQTSVSGNAGTATKLASARTISLTGDVTGSTTFDGSADKSITATIPIPVSGNYFRGFAKVNTDGVMDIGKYIDFHNTNNATSDYNTRIVCDNNGTNTLTLPTASGTIALTSDISSAIGNINTLLDELNGTSV